MELTNEQLDKVNVLVTRYKKSEEKAKRKNLWSGHAGAIAEIRSQMVDMAQGGSAGTAGSGLPGQGTIRTVYYAGYPDEFFQKVCIAMRWQWSKNME